MADKSINTEITVGGKKYNLCGSESAEYMQEVATYLNKKLAEIDGSSAYWQLPTDAKNVMLQINIVDDLFKAYTKITDLEDRVKDKESSASAATIERKN